MDPHSGSNANRTVGVFLFAGAFLATWSAWAIFVIRHPLPADGWPVRVVARVALFVVPVLLYVRISLRQPPIKYLRLTEHVGRGLELGLVASLLPLAELIWRSLHAHRVPQLPRSADVWVNVIIAAPLAEEILFRGLLLRELTGAFGSIRAAIISSVLFAALHFPFWYFSGAKTGWNLVTSLAVIFAIGMLCCYLVTRSRTLIAPVVFHFMNNLASSCTT